MSCYLNVWGVGACLFASTKENQFCASVRKLVDSGRVCRRCTVACNIFSLLCKGVHAGSQIIGWSTCAPAYCRCVINFHTYFSSLQDITYCILVVLLWSVTNAHACLQDCSLEGCDYVWPTNCHSCVFQFPSDVCWVCGVIGNGANGDFGVNQLVHLCYLEPIYLICAP